MNQKAHLIGGRSDWALLTEHGEEQAARLGQCLARHGLKPDRVISSPAVRARQTAERALSTMGMDLEIEIEDGFQELDQGKWEGLPRDQIYTPELIERIHTMQGNFRAPGGESPRDVARRMYASLEHHVVQQEMTGSVHIYTHGFAIRSLVGLMLDWPHRKVYETTTDNTSVTRLKYDSFWQVLDIGIKPE